jgi:hypothetical protein
MGNRCFVSLRHAADRPVFKAVETVKKGGMRILDYSELSEIEMAAADRAASIEECQTHLDRAVRYAQLACFERHGPGRSNVVHIGSARAARPLA